MPASACALSAAPSVVFSQILSSVRYPLMIHSHMTAQGGKCAQGFDVNRGHKAGGEKIAFSESCTN